MSVYQATGRVAVSLPNGASSLPLEICEKLERFKRIYLWMDDDVKVMKRRRWREVEVEKAKKERKSYYIL